VSDINVLTSKIDDIISSNGFTPSPDQVNEALLRFIPLDKFLEIQNITLPILATDVHIEKERRQVTRIPKVCANISELLETNAARQFLALRLEDSPYLKIYPQATLELIKGLLNSFVEQAYRELGLDNYLQLSFFKIIDAMGNAILKKNNLSAFM